MIGANEIAQHKPCESHKMIGANQVAQNKTWPRQRAFPTFSQSGACFIRTDQLDGETDWKLRVAVPTTQRMKADADLRKMHASIYADAYVQFVRSAAGLNLARRWPPVLVF